MTNKLLVAYKALENMIEELNNHSGYVVAETEALEQGRVKSEHKDRVQQLIIEDEIRVGAIKPCVEMLAKALEVTVKEENGYFEIVG